MRQLTNRKRTAGLTGFAALVSGLTLTVGLFAAGPVVADSFSIGFGYSSHGKHFGHDYKYRGHHRYSHFRHGYTAWRGYGYDRFGCGVGPFSRSSVFYRGSNVGVGLSYRTGYYRSYRPSAYIIESPRVVEQRTVIVREPEAAAQPAAVEDRRSAGPAETDVYRDRVNPFPEPRGDRQAEAGLDGLAVGEYENAREGFAEAMAASPSVAEHKIGYGLAAALAGDLRAAGFAFERAVRQGGATAFQTFPVEGAAREDLHALVRSTDMDTAGDVTRAGLKKLAAANPLPAATYEEENEASPTAL